MKLRFTPRATQDLIEIGDFLRERSPAAALRVRASILDTLRILAEFPRMGRLQATPVFERLRPADILISSTILSMKPLRRL